jgi:hypothetical protein
MKVKKYFYFFILSLLLYYFYYFGTLYWYANNERYIGTDFRGRKGDAPKDKNRHQVKNEFMNIHFASEAAASTTIDV